MRKGRKNKKKFKCPSCTKLFQSEWDLDQHCRGVHGKPYKDLKEFVDNSRMTLGDFMVDGD